MLEVPLVENHDEKFPFGQVFALTYVAFVIFLVVVDLVSFYRLQPDESIAPEEVTFKRRQSLRRYQKL